MRARVVVAGLMALAFACGMPVSLQAADNTAQLGVGVSVRPSHAAPRALATLPLPPDSQALGATPFGGSYQSRGNVADTVGFFHLAMHGEGYHLVSEQQHPDGTRLLWERDGERVQLECRAVLGTTAATRIIVVASTFREG